MKKSTAMHQALEEKIQQLEGKIEYLTNIIDTIPINIYWRDLDGVNLGCNKSMLELHKVIKQDYVGKNVADIIGDDAEAIKKNDEEIVRANRAVTLEETAQLPDGRVLTFLSRKAPIRDKNNHVVGILGASYDITDRKQVEVELSKTKQKLELSEKKLKTLFTNLSTEITGQLLEKTTPSEYHVQYIKRYFENIIDCIPANVYWKNREGINVGCNKALLKYRGLHAREEYCGKKLNDVAPENESIETLVKTDVDVMSKNQPITLEEEGVSAAGKKVTFLTHKTPLHDDQGEVVGLLGVSIDITKQKEAELNLRKSEEERKIQMERVDTMKEIAASIAHEMRTPVRAIISSAEGIDKYLPQLIAGYRAAKAANLEVPNILDRKLDLLDEVVKNLRTEGIAANTIIDMLLMNIRETPIDQEKFQSLSVRDCIQHAIDRYPFQRDESALVQLEAGDFVFHGDELLLVHVLFNLLKNALYYIAAAGKGEIVITPTTDADYHLLSFKDTGKGIKKEDLPCIFDPFFTKTDFGTGIGLSFCKMVIERMGGQISCQSEEGLFTEFLIAFPKISK